MLSTEEPLVLPTKPPMLPLLAKLPMLELAMVTPKVSITAMSITAMPMSNMVDPVCSSSSGCTSS